MHRAFYASHLRSLRDEVREVTARIHLAALDALIRHLESKAMPTGARAVDASTSSPISPRTPSPLAGSRSDSPRGIGSSAAVARSTRSTKATPKRSDRRPSRSPKAATSDLTGQRERPLAFLRVPCLAPGHSAPQRDLGRRSTAGGWPLSPSRRRRDLVRLPHGARSKGVRPAPIRMYDVLRAIRLPAEHAERIGRFFDALPVEWQLRRKR